MSPAAQRRTAPAHIARLSIGQVLDLLREEFPDLSHSKLHYLEAESLISPDRTPGGYRKYSREDVDRLVFVLRAQRDRFWPLKVIKEHLDAHGVTDADGAAVTSIASRPGPSAQIRAVRLDLAGVMREARVDRAFMDELVQFGMIDPDREVYGSSDVEVAKAARELAEVGLHPRHLVMVRTSVQRQVHMIRSVTSPRTRASDLAARGGAEDLERDLGESMNSLHDALLRVTLRSS